MQTSPGEPNTAQSISSTSIQDYPPSLPSIVTTNITYLNNPIEQSNIDPKLITPPFHSHQSFSYIQPTENINIQDLNPAGSSIPGVTGNNTSYLNAGLPSNQYMINGQSSQNTLNGFLPGWVFEYGSQTMPAGWDEMDWSFLDSVSIGADATIQEKEDIKVDEGELSAQEQEHL